MLASIPLQIPTALAFVCFIYNPIFFFFFEEHNARSWWAETEEYRAKLINQV